MKYRIRNNTIYHVLLLLDDNGLLIADLFSPIELIIKIILKDLSFESWKSDVERAIETCTSGAFCGSHV